MTARTPEATLSACVLCGYEGTPVPGRRAYAVPLRPVEDGELQHAEIADDGTRWRVFTDPAALMICADPAECSPWMTARRLEIAAAG